MLAASNRLGPYEIIAPLGAGGMGEVYRARDTRLGREVAVKVLPAAFAHDPERQARFESEARAVAALSHPNILAIHDYGTEGGVTYAVMELLEGETLRSRLTKGPLPWREAVEVGAAVAEGLAAAHAKGIVHRDIKPENLFLTSDGRVKILDFGLARFMPLAGKQSETSPYISAPTGVGTVVGTVGYMSPEQVRGQPAESASDLFSLGCVLLEMITGVRAFHRETAAETMTAILHDEPEEPADARHQVPAELVRLVRHCLVKNQNQRLQSARDLGLALKSVRNQVGASPPAGAELPSNGGTTRVDSSPRSMRFVATMVASVLLLVGIAMPVYLLTRNGGTPGTPAAPIKAFDAIAVLPFETQGDPGTEPRLSDPGETLAEHLSNSLAQVRRQDFKVRPFESIARRYKQQRPDARTIGRELNVEVIVMGTVRQRGGDLSVSISLVDTRDDQQLWGKRYDRKLVKILDLQDEIARDLAANLRLQLTGEEEQRLTKRYTEDPEAYLMYREGIYHINKLTLDEVQKGKAYCEAALKKQPKYVPALMGIAMADIRLGLMHLGPRQTHPEAKQLLLRVVATDDTLADAHAGLSTIYATHDWDWPAAERAAKRAFDLGSHQPVYGFRLASQGRLPEALAVLQRGQNLDPLSAPRMNEMAACYNWMRQPDQAVLWARRAIEVDPEFPLSYGELSLALIQKGMHEEAIAELQKSAAAGKGQPQVSRVLGYAYAAAGRQAEARKVLQELKGRTPTRMGDAFAIARIHTALGEKSQAVQWLHKACEERDAAVLVIKVDPAMDALRREPAFEDLLRHMGLADSVAKPNDPARSIAVLPFVYAGRDPKMEMLSQTIAGHIIDCLGQVRRTDLKVRPLSSVLRYARERPGNPDIGEALRVPLIVTGTILQRGDELTVTVEVVDAPEDNLRWSKSYPSKGGETLGLDLQDQIVQDVAANLGLRLSAEEERRLTRRRTANKDAYNLYREAIYHFHKYTPEGLAAGIDAGKQAIQKDPNFALAYFAVARCYILRGSLFDGPKKSHPLAQSYLDQALALDADLPEAHGALGAIHLFRDWNWAEAERELKLALKIDPNVILTWNLLGFWQWAQGRLDEALVSIQRGRDLDPLAAARWNELAMCYNAMGNYESAIAAAKKAIELDSNFWQAYGQWGAALALTNRHEEAVQRLKAGLERGKGHPRLRGILGCAYAMAGKGVEAHIELNALTADERFGAAHAKARIYATLGENDRAFTWLRKAFDERDTAVIWLKTDAHLAGLRSDPRFAVLIKEMGLPP